mmetsp:Transcript_40118/g.45663  ORF Transcript_40118/g.45663 Transcript_40118/m.45663 type:complete len:141 (+) Transcript_40118:120-542(+)
MEASTIANTPAVATILLHISRNRDDPSPHNLVWMMGGTTKAMGQPNNAPIRDTTLSRESMVVAATIANDRTRTEEITYRFVKKPFFLKPRFSTRVNDMDFVAISNAGKFCKGNVIITAKEYAIWTEVANIPEGSDVVRTV